MLAVAQTLIAWGPVVLAGLGAVYAACTVLAVKGPEKYRPLFAAIGTNAEALRKALAALNPPPPPSAGAVVAP